MNRYRNNSKSVTARIAEFISRIELADIPIHVRETAKLHVIDGLATMIAGGGDGGEEVTRRPLKK